MNHPESTAMGMHEDLGIRCGPTCPVEELARKAEAAARVFAGAAALIRETHMLHGATVDDLRAALQPGMLALLDGQAAERRACPGFQPNEGFHVDVSRSKAAVRDCCRILFPDGEEG